MTARAISPIVSPFQRLADALAGIEPAMPAISLALGEPQHPIPDFVAPVLAASVNDFGRYPAIRGTHPFRAAMRDWLDRRYDLQGVIDADRMIIPLNGTREGLFSAAIAAGNWYAAKLKSEDRSKAKPAVLMPNPFYPAYWAGALAAAAEIVPLDCSPQHDGLPDLAAIDPSLLARTVAFYLASPANPQGSVASASYWRRLVELARRHDFLLFADECYSDLYRSAPPAGVLSSAASGGFANVVTFHSLSKRSNLPGLRVGFAAGDPDFIDFWSSHRNVAAPQVPIPAQAVAIAAYGDQAHVERNRIFYNEKFRAAEHILGNRFGYRTPAGGFFLWLDMSEVGGGEAAAIRLWREGGVKTLPGAYLAMPGPDGINPGNDFLRLAMVHDLATSSEALNRLANIFD